MSETSGTDPVADLRAALAGRDAWAVTTLLATVPIGVLVSGEQALVGSDDRGTVLPVFLSSDSVDAFTAAQGQESGELRLLRAKELHALLVGLEVDQVVFDPALPSAMRVPGAEVREMLQGEYVDADGQRRIAGDVSFAPDPSLRQVLASAAGQQLVADLGTRAWATTRTSRGIDAPSLALAADVPAADIERLLDVLRQAQLPWPNLEVTQLDAEQTAAAQEQWAVGRLAPPG